MSFDRNDLAAAIARHGRVVRVVIARAAGSSPREIGAAMLIWEGGQSGTIGGGALEHAATARARTYLSDAQDAVWRAALGPELGQCCGGAVTLLAEVWNEARLPPPDAGIVARPLPGHRDERPLALARIEARARAEGLSPPPQIVQGWMIEPVSQPNCALWVWGAGHVGRAIVALAAPLPGLRITWVDTASDRFPTPPEGVLPRIAPEPGRAVTDAPRDAHHLILTYSHALDLDLCHRLLGHGFATAGLIGSATKWARFRARLGQLGHAPAAIDRIRCPIGDPALGKHPQAIAVGVAAELLKNADAGKGADREAAG